MENKNTANQTETTKTSAATEVGSSRMIQIKPTELSFGTNEAIKMLRANIQFSGYGIKAISLTSCNPNEGKSFVSFELAKSLAEMGKRTLFLDCDTRNSVLQARLGVTKRLPGLTEFLVGKAKIGEILFSTNVPKLHMIFAGAVAPNPSELLAGEMFERLCEALKKNYDYIILDTAPLGLVIDSAVIARQCDGTILVIEAGGTDRKQAMRVKQQLESADVRILGVVMNKVGAKGRGYGYGEYGSYGGYDQKPKKKGKK